MERGSSRALDPQTVARIAQGWGRVGAGGRVHGAADADHPEAGVAVDPDGQPHLGASSRTEGRA